MLRMKSAIIVPIILILLYLVYQHWFRDESQVIRKLLLKGTQLASFESQGHPFERLDWARQVGTYFSEDVSFVLLTGDGEREVLKGRRLFIEKLVALRSFLDQFALIAIKPEVTVTGKSATVQVLGRGIGRESGRRDYFKEEHQLLLKLQKNNRHWQITRVQNTEPYQGELGEDFDEFTGNPP